MQEESNSGWDGMERRMKDSASPYRPLPSEEEAALPQCDILVRRRAVRHHHSVLCYPVPVDPCGPNDVIVVIGDGLVKRRVVQTNAGVVSAICRQ